MIFEDLEDTVLETFDSFDQHECVRKFVLKDDIIAFVAVHNTNLGPALGGLRMKDYASERDAIHDVLRLSRGMTYKNAMAGLPLGGGKAVIMGDPRKDKDSALMEEMGLAVESFEGDYVTAEDSGTTEEDMLAISKNTQNVTGLPPEILAGSGYGELGGNPSPVTALGVYKGIQAAARFRYGSEDLAGKKVAVQGTGSVGIELCKLLQQDNVELIITDIDEIRLEEIKHQLGGVDTVRPEDIYTADADIFAPCALGGVLNDQTIEQMSFDIIAGAANNQLMSAHHDRVLAEENILYVPDYVINSGGVICVGYEYFRKSGYNPLDFDITRESMIVHAENIGKTVTETLAYAHDEGLNPGEAADRLAEERFLEGKGLESSSESPASSGQSGGMTLVQ